ncbi:prostaglandin E receptor 2b subtype EP2 [Brachyhypopomus gauderio]|uniref:prostaglandin E receptor 2b subtype EP2 n=1 Tax=Brachyhypopomus gauderio TaxID=698409 RepID=UPI004040F739
MEHPHFGQNISNLSMEKCRNVSTVLSGTPTTSAIMFSAGVLGNVVALILLKIRRKNQSASLFQVLVTALVITDLLGTFSVSPLVITAYSRNQSMIGLSGNDSICSHFGFAMTFFSLVTLAILLSMALERWLSIGLPYFYERHINTRGGYITITLIYLVCTLFCLTPFFGFGRYVQYCPGTWCFIDLNSDEFEHKVYKNIYASCMLAMIICTVFCNASVIYHLLLMYRRRKANRSSLRRTKGSKRSLSLTKEVEHLVLLGFMTIAFLICSLPLVINVYISSSGDTKYSAMDLTALLLLSVNPIIDPWVFIILSPPVPRLLWEVICKPPQPQSSHDKLGTTRPQPTKMDHCIITESCQTSIPIELSQG